MGEYALVAIGAGAMWIAFFCAKWADDDRGFRPNLWLISVIITAMFLTCVCLRLY